MISSLKGQYLDSRVSLNWSLIHGSSWSGLINAGHISHCTHPDHRMAPATLGHRYTRIHPPMLQCMCHWCHIVVHPGPPCHMYTPLMDSRPQNCGSHLYGPCEGRTTGRNYDRQINFNCMYSLTTLKFSNMKLIMSHAEFKHTVKPLI